MEESRQCNNKTTSSRTKNSKMCWFCGHYAKTVDNHCMCCYRITTRPKKHQKILDIKRKLDDIIENNVEPEYRFYVTNWCCFIKKSDLDEYQKLPNVEKHDRYYHWINSKFDSDKIARVFR